MVRSILAFIVFIIVLIFTTFGHAHDLGIVTTQFQKIYSNQEFTEYQLSAFASDTQKFRFSDIKLPKQCEHLSHQTYIQTIDAVTFTFKCWPSLTTSDTLRLPWQVSGILIHSSLHINNTPQLAIPKNGEIQLPFNLLTGVPEPTIDRAKHYLTLGVEHILQGYDHLLFVTMMLILVGNFSNVLKVITAFTIAHSITLSAAFLEVIQLPIGAVEASIALSIVYLAVLYFKQQGSDDSSKSEKNRFHIMVLPGLFGLLHGFGFASALTDLNVPQSDLFIALLSFNLGVELGQILFVITASIITFIVNKPSFAELGYYARTGLSFSIGTLSVFWFLQRATSVIGSWH
jgi:hydrogenase/urease accessory protein HupE